MTSQRSRQASRKQLRNRPRQRGASQHIQAVFDALPAHIAALDAAGTIVAVNAAWHRFAEANGYAGTAHGVGLNYLEICGQAAGLADARAAEQAIRAVLAREQAEYAYEYTCHGPSQQRWFRFHAAWFAGAGPICVIVSHDEITDYKREEERAQASEIVYRRLIKQAEHSLGESNGRLQALFEHAQDAFLLVDDHGRFIDVNPAACNLTGYSRAELLNLKVVDLVPLPNRQDPHALWQKPINAGVRRGERMLLRKDGSLIPVEFMSVPQIVPGVQLSVLHDITRRHDAEERLRDHAKRLDVLHAIDQAIISSSSIEAISQAALGAIHRLVPYWRASMLVFDSEHDELQLVAIYQNGIPLETPVQHFSVGKVAEAEASLPALRRGENYVFDIRDMLQSWPAAAELLASGMRYQICTPLMAQDELVGSVQIVAPTLELFDSVYMPILREVLDSLAIGVRQARLFEQVRAGRERQHELSRRLVAAQELERRQLARELHDQIGQNLAVLNMNLTGVRNHLSRESALRLDAQLVEAIKLVDQTVERIRNVMAELRPAILDDFGLVAALRWYVRHFARHTDLVVLLEVEEPRAAPRLPAEIETALFRVAQEALTNVIKHAHATLATLKLTMLDQHIRLAIGDDGVGFAFGASRRPNQRWSLGLMAMQERMEAVGGQLLIDSTPGQGTRIIAEMAR